MNEEHKDKVRENAVLAREQVQRHQEELDSIAPVYRIETLEEAKKPETIAYVIERLSQGERWDIIRCELGLKPAYLDVKWREIRRLVHEIRMPETDQAALLETHDDVKFWIHKLEESFEDLEEKISETRGATTIKNRAGDDVVLESMTQAALVRCRQDTLKTIIEKKNLFLENYLKVRQLAKKERTNQGPTIIINNNIPRPMKDVKTEVITQVAANVIALDEARDADTDKE